MTAEAAPPSRFRRFMNGAALAVLVGTLLWLAYHWPAIPATLPLQMNLNAPPTLGGKGRLILLPMVMPFLCPLLSYTEKIGVINMPDLDSPERNHAARAGSLGGVEVFLRDPDGPDSTHHPDLLERGARRGGGVVLRVCGWCGCPVVRRRGVAWPGEG